MSMSTSQDGSHVLGLYLQRYRAELMSIAAFSFFINLMTLAPTLYMLQIFDRVLVSRSELTLVALTGFLVCFLSLQFLADRLRAQLLLRTGIRMDQLLNEQVFTASLDARLRSTAETTRHGLMDLTALRQFLTGNGATAVFDMPWALIYIAVLFLMHPLLGWLGLIFLILQALVARWSHAWTSPISDQAAIAAARASDTLATKLRHGETMRAMGMQRNLRQRWLTDHQKQTELQHTLLSQSQRTVALTKFSQYTQQSLVLALGAWLVIQDELSVGAMVAASALMSSALRPLGTLVETWRQMVDANSAHSRLNALLAARSQAPARGDEGGDFKGEVTLVQLCARAPGWPQLILRGVDAKVRPGQVIAIMGPSGSGKSTLMKCLVGVWPDLTGAVLIDGRPLHAWSRSALGAHVGYLSQEVDLIDGTIAENIARFGLMDAEAVVGAARRAGVHEMILRMPEGYDTVLSNGGAALSGGQRQRIALARALFGDPKLLVLDEPSANLDEVGIRALGQAISELKSRGATIFLALHQRNLPPQVDRVFRLTQGTMTEDLDFGSSTSKALSGSA